jgi:hypothetical protein
MAEGPGPGVEERCRGPCRGYDDRTELGIDHGLAALLDHAVHRFKTSPSGAIGDRLWWQYTPDKRNDQIFAPGRCDNPVTLERIFSSNATAHAMKHSRNIEVPIRCLQRRKDHLTT